MRTYEVLVEAGQVLQFRRAVGELDAPVQTVNQNGAVVLTGSAGARADEPPSR